MEMVDTTPLVDKVDYGEYFYTIVKALVDRGFTRGKNIYGAPYDFRKGPSKTRRIVEHPNVNTTSLTLARVSFQMRARNGSAV